METGLSRERTIAGETDARTPAIWRLTALAILVGGAAAGDRLAAAPIRRVAGPAFLVAATTVAALIRGARLAEGATAPLAEVEGPRVDVLVPARDEAAALPRLVADLAAQDHRSADGSPRFRVVVIDDRSCDGTGEAARAASVAAGPGFELSVVRRDPHCTPDGKGAALAAVPPELCDAPVLVVLDADARVHSWFLRRAADRVAGGSVAFTARRCLYHAGSTPLAAAQAAEQDLDGLQLRARIALGGSGEFRGNGMVVRQDILAAAGGWPSGTLTEDLDLSTRLAALGIRIDWAPELVAWEAPTATVLALGRQRLRWAEGSARRFFALLVTALASPAMPAVAKADLALYAGQLVLPPVLGGVVIGGIRRRRASVAFALVGAYTLAAMALAGTAARRARRTADRETSPYHDPATQPSGRPRDGRPGVLDRPMVSSVLGGLFAAHWLIVMPTALLRVALRTGPLRFDRTRDRLL